MAPAYGRATPSLRLGPPATLVVVVGQSDSVAKAFYNRLGQGLISLRFILRAGL